VCYSGAGYQSVMLSAQSYPYQPCCSESCRKAHNCIRPPESSSLGLDIQPSTNIKKLDKLDLWQRPLTLLRNHSHETRLHTSCNTVLGPNGVNSAAAPLSNKQTIKGCKGVEITDNTQKRNTHLDAQCTIQACGSGYSSASSTADRGNFWPKKDAVSEDMNVQQQSGKRRKVENNYAPNGGTSTAEIKTSVEQVHSMDLSENKSVSIREHSNFENYKIRNDLEQPEAVGVSKFDNYPDRTKSGKAILNPESLGDRKGKWERPTIEIIDNESIGLNIVTRSHRCREVLRDQHPHLSKSGSRRESKCDTTFMIVDSSDLPLQANGIANSNFSRHKVDVSTTHLLSKNYPAPSAESSLCSSSRSTNTADAFKRRHLSDINVSRNSLSSAASSPCSNADIKKKMDELKRKRSSDVCSNDGDESCSISCRRELFHPSDANETFLVKTEGVSMVVTSKRIEPSCSSVLTPSVLSVYRDLTSDCFEGRVIGNHVGARTSVRKNSLCSGDQQGSFLDETFVFASRKSDSGMDSFSVSSKGNQLTCFDVLTEPDVDAHVHNSWLESESDDDSVASITSGPSGRNIRVTLASIFIDTCSVCRILCRLPDNKICSKSICKYLCYCTAQLDEIVCIS